MINGMPILVHRDHDETIQGDCLSIHFYLNFTLRKREKKKNDLLRWNNAFNQSEIIQNFVPVRPGQKKTIAHPSHRFEESR